MVNLVRLRLRLLELMIILSSSATIIDQLQLTTNHTIMVNKTGTIFNLPTTTTTTTTTTKRWLIRWLIVDTIS